MDPDDDSCVDIPVFPHAIKSFIPHRISIPHSHKHLKLVARAPELKLDKLSSLVRRKQNVRM